jgi:hypothetical protein
MYDKNDKYMGAMQPVLFIKNFVAKQDFDCINYLFDKIMCDEQV